MLRYQDFLNKVVDESKKRTRDYYDNPMAPSMKPYLEGALAGLEACRNLSPPQLAALLERAAGVHHKAFYVTVRDRYWRITCFMHEVEWVCTVVSAALMNQGMMGIVMPTDRAIQMANSIISETEEN